MATKTAVIVVSNEAVLIWAIPPLSPQPPDFSDHNHTHMPPPLFKIPLPGIFLHPARINHVVCAWYFGSLQPLYFGMLCQDTLYKFQIILKPDLSAASLHVINNSEITMHRNLNIASSSNYMICEDTLVSFCIHSDPRSNGYQWRCEVYTESISPRLANGISPGGFTGKIVLPDTENDSILFLCPASGRLVRLDSRNSVDVLDFF